MRHVTRRPAARLKSSAVAKDKRAEIRIADNGPGLPTGSEEKVFDKFFRGSTVAPDGRRGVGLGLAICQAIVEAHGGKITAANRREGGAEFVINLAVQPKRRRELKPRSTATSASV